MNMKKMYFYQLIKAVEFSCEREREREREREALSNGFFF